MLKLSKLIDFAKKIWSIENIRKRLRHSRFSWKLQDLGAGSKFYPDYTKISEIVKHSSSTALKSIFIAFIMKMSKNDVVVELGTNIGLNAMYLASFMPDSKIITVEGDKILCGFARHFARISGIKNIEFLNKNFDDILLKIIKHRQPTAFYIDGNHKYPATLRYFYQIESQSHQPVLIIIDDILWSKQMYKAWREMHSERIVFKLNLFKFGIIKLKQSQWTTTS